MKNIKKIIALVFGLAAFNAVAQKINTEKSSVEWLGKKIGGQHVGTINIKSGSIQVKKDAITRGNFIIDMTSITNTDLTDKGYNDKLVGHLKSDDFFGVKKFPEAILEIISSTKFEGGKSSVTANLTIKGKTEIIKFVVSYSTNIYEAKISVDRSKFNVRYGSNSFFDDLGDKAIDDVFVLDVKLVVE